MAVSGERIRQAALSLAAVEGLSMDADALLEDVVLLSVAFPEEGDFEAACANTAKAVRLLATDSVSSSALKYEFAGWESYHYQPKVGQGMKATCRIVFRRTGEGVEVEGFGHRRIPADFYERMSRAR